MQEFNVNLQSTSRILLDLTTSFTWRGKNAVGIVRTEREIAYHLLNDNSLDVIPTIFSNGNIYAISKEEAIRLVTIVKPQISAKKISDEEIPTPVIAQSKKTRAKAFLRRAAITILNKFLSALPNAARDSAKESVRHGYIAFRQTLKSIFKPEHNTLPQTHQQPTVDTSNVPSEDDLSVDLSFRVYPDSKDIFLMLGLGWDVINCRHLGTIKSATGMKIATVIYDLIPTKFPHFLGGTPKDYFQNYFIQMTDLADHCFCISKTTERDYHEFCKKHRSETPSTSVIYLGANLPSQANSDEFDSETIALLKTRKFALSVGTFEVRKNYGLLIDVWEDLCREPSFQLDLIIAGMQGWGVDDIIQRLTDSPLYGKRIHWFRGLSDAGISWLYENSHVVTFPSFYEGWGLPIIEAYLHGKHVISSNRGSVPEAGLGISCILNIDNPEDWKNELRRQSMLSAPQKIQSVKLPTWEEATIEIKNKLAAL